MAGDGEGATALFEVKVVHAASKEDAVILSKSVVTSSLTKAAIFGHDANWGRILCALGYSGVEFDPEQVTFTLKVQPARPFASTRQVSLVEVSPSTEIML